MAQNDASARVGLAVKQDLLSRGINTKEAARKLGVTPAGVSVYFSGRPFSAKAARKWAKTLDLDENFLVTGLGHPSDYVTMAVKPEERKLILEMRKNSKKKGAPKNLDLLRMEQSIKNASDALNQLKMIVK